MARPKGSRDKAPRRSPARKIAALYGATGVMPLDVLLDNMRDAWAEVARLKRIKAERAAVLVERERAGFWAEKASEFIQPKLSRQEQRMTGPDGGAIQVKVEDVRSRIAGELARIASRSGQAGGSR